MGKKYYFFQYWSDIPGQAERRRETEVIGPVKQMTRSEAERKKLEFISKLKLNSNDYRIPSSRNLRGRGQTLSGSVRSNDASRFHVFSGERTLKDASRSDWNDVPIEHIRIDSVNEWAWKKRQAGVSWPTIKDALRTMQRVLSAFRKTRDLSFRKGV